MNDHLRHDYTPGTEVQQPMIDNLILTTADLPADLPQVLRISSTFSRTVLRMAALPPISIPLNSRENGTRSGRRTTPTVPPYPSGNQSGGSLCSQFGW